MRLFVAIKIRVEVLGENSIFHISRYLFHGIRNDIDFKLIGMILKASWPFTN